MKKLTCTFVALLLLCLCTVAYAADPLTVDITALDYQTGMAVSKTYVPNELFKLKVDIGIPRFYDLTDMELIVELDGVKLDENNLILADGSANRYGPTNPGGVVPAFVIPASAVYDPTPNADSSYNLVL